MPATGSATSTLELSEIGQSRLYALMNAMPASCLLYGVIDVNRDESLYDALQAEPRASEVACLYDGDAAIRYGRYAPYLITAHQASPLFQRWLNEGWNAHWGIFLAGNVSTTKLKRHLKRFLTGLDPKGKKTWFRFYDPQILPGVLAAMNPGQLHEWFDSMPACMAPCSEGLWRGTPKDRMLDRLTQVSQLQIQVFRINAPC